MMKADNLRRVGMLAIPANTLSLSAFGQMRPTFPPPPPVRQDFPKLEPILPKPIGLTPTLKDIPSAPPLQKPGTPQSNASDPRRPDPAPSNPNSTARPEPRPTAPASAAPEPAVAKSDPGWPRWLLIGAIAVAIAYFLGRSSGVARSS